MSGRLWLRLAQLALPMLLLGAMVFGAERDLRSGDVWTLRLSGGDPRDLLRGHYVRFLIDWNWDAAPGECPVTGACCVCLRRGPDGSRVNPIVKRLSCDQASTCDAAVRGHNLGNDRFDVGLDRVYVAETAVRRFEDRTRNGGATIDVVVNASQNALLKAFRIDGKPWREVVPAR